MLNISTCNKWLRTCQENAQCISWVIHMKSSKVLQVTQSPAQQFGGHTLVQFGQICAPRVRRLLHKEFLCVKLSQYKDSLMMWKEVKMRAKGSRGKAANSQYEKLVCYLSVCVINRCQARCWFSTSWCCHSRAAVCLSGSRASAGQSCGSQHGNEWVKWSKMELPSQTRVRLRALSFHPALKFSQSVKFLRQFWLPHPRFHVASFCM